MKSHKGMGFKAAASSIERREGVSKKTADRELAESTRGASASAKRDNPDLRRVKGK